MDIFTALLVAGFFFIMGAAVVGVLWYLQGAARKNKGNSLTVTPVAPNLSEVARLMRDKQTQDLVVEIDGKTYTAAYELSPAQQRRLTFTSNVLTKWLTQPAPAPVPEEQPAIIPPDTSLPEFPPMPADSGTAEPKAEYVPPFAAEPVKEVKPVSTNLPDMVGGLLTPTPQPAPQFKSIAMQINDILQAQLVGTALENRGITLNDTPDGGVTVTLDGEKYPGVKDVPDEEVRKAIRVAVLEWETKK